MSNVQVLNYKVNKIYFFKFWHNLEFEKIKTRRKEKKMELFDISCKRTNGLKISLHFIETGFPLFIEVRNLKMNFAPNFLSPGVF